MIEELIGSEDYMLNSLKDKERNSGSVSEEIDEDEYDEAYLEYQEFLLK